MQHMLWGKFPMVDMFSQAVSSPLGLNTIYLLKINAGGDFAWCKTYNGDAGRSVQETADKGFILTSHESVLIKTDANGNTGCSIEHILTAVDSVTHFGNSLAHFTDASMDIYPAFEYIL